jgi:hypothetical protein
MKLFDSGMEMKRGPKSQNDPSAAKTALILSGVGGTDKSVPFQTAKKREFFSKL